MKKIKNYTSCFIFFLILTAGVKHSFAQQNPKGASKIDSLRALLKNDVIDTNKVKHLNELSWELRVKNTDTSLVLSEEALKLAIRITSETKQFSIKQAVQPEIGQAYHQIAFAHYFKGNYPAALQFAEKALNVWGILLSINNVSPKILIRKAATFGNMGIVYSDQGNYPKALEYYFLSLKTAQLAANASGNANNNTPEQKQLVAKNFGNIGIVYRNQGDFTKALEYYFKALKMDEELGKKNRIASDLGNIGNVYAQKKEYPKALEYHVKALKLDEELGNKKGIAIHLGNLGNIYTDQKDYPKALNYYFKSLKLREELGDKNYIALQLGNIGAVYTSQKKHKEAELYLLKALTICDSIGILNEKMSFEFSISELYIAKGEYKNAYEHYKRYSTTKDSIFNLEKNKELTRHEMNYEFEKKEAIAKAEQEKQATIANAERKRQRLLLWLIAAVAIAVALIATIIFRSLRVTRKQKSIIEEKNILITDSIEYARNIQNIILPSDEIIKQYIPELFILYLPKDIVSGDFYWLSPAGGGVRHGRTGEVSHLTPADCILFAAVDCTGHGVPGAFMSVMAFNMLENIVAEKKFTQPALILDELNKVVVETLHQQSESSSAKYGMDISLIKLEILNPKSENNSVKAEYAGAHNSLCVVREGELSEVKANKTTIGMAKEKFTNHSVEIQKGDMLYFFTDGYADQKGGPENKKFFSAQFKKLLVDASKNNVVEQKEYLLKTFIDWKNNNEQIDDVLLIGVRV